MKKDGFLPASEISASKVELEVRSAFPKNGQRDVSLLFVHGLYHAAWAFEEDWLPYFSSRGYKCYAMSLRGHGASQGRENLKSTSFDEYLSDLRQVLTRIEGKVVVVGHSLGGMLIQKHLESEALAGAFLSRRRLRNLCGMADFNSCELFRFRF